MQTFTSFDKDQVVPKQLTGAQAPKQQEIKMTKIIRITEIENKKLQAALESLTVGANNAEDGTNDNKYQIYVAAAESLGWVVKSYEEWLAS